MSELAGKTAMVTGASAGIGRAAAIALGAEGTAVVVADRDVERGERTAREIVIGGGSIPISRVRAQDGRHTVMRCGVVMGSCVFAYDC